MDLHYVLDALGRRIGKLRDGNLQKGWLYADALNPIAQLDSAGNVEATFIYGTHAHVPDAMVMADGTSSFTLCAASTLRTQLRPSRAFSSRGFRGTLAR